MPAQSGNDDVLRRMRRDYSRDAYLALVERARALIPDVALSSDFIAGFCGETEAEHEDSVSLIREVGYAQAFLFAYSMRERTRAYHRLQDDVPEDVKMRRLRELIDAFRETLPRVNAHEPGREHRVLVEGHSRRSTPDSPQWTGRTDTNKRVAFSAPPGAALRAGEYATVRVDEVRGQTLAGEAVVAVA